MIIRGMGLGGVLTFLTGTFLTFRNKLPLLTCCTYFWRAFVGFLALALSLQMEPEVLQPVVSKIIPTKGSRWPKATTNKISLLRLIIFEVVSVVNPIEPLLLVTAGTQQIDGTWKHLKKWRPMSMLHKKINKCTKKGTLGPTAGHGVTMLPCCSLWLLRCHKRSGTEASRRGKEWMSECRPDMIRMIEHHRFLMFFVDPWRAKSSHWAGETQIFTLGSHACQSKSMSMWQTFFDASCKYQHFVS